MKRILRGLRVLGAALEALDVGIVSGHLDRRQATNRFVKCLEDVAFVDTQKQTEERS
jgi:hypothetical protein